MSKCRSFSLTSGKPSNIKFQIGTSEVPSIEEEEQKFLGAKMFFSGKSEEVFTHVKTTLLKKLKNIDNTQIRGEYKVAIYHRYLLPSLRFLLTIHDITKTHLKKLDTLTDKFLKSWAGLPRCATNSILHLQHTLHIKTIQHLYQETHAISHVSSRLKADEAIDNKLIREQKWKRKESVTVTSEEAFKNINIEESNGDTESSHLKQYKQKIKKNLQMNETKNIANHVSKLVKQGQFLDLLITSEQDATWKSFIYNLPTSTMRFLLNSCIDTLPTKANLVQWGKATSDRCKLCGARETINHILNCCKTSLEQGRYTYRHNSILSYIFNLLDKDLYTIGCDLPNATCSSGSTIPTNVVVTTLIPDLVITSQGEKKMWVYELTVPFETRIDEAHSIKESKYDSILMDIENRGYEIEYEPFEIGSRGHVSKDNIGRLKRIFNFCKAPYNFKTFLKNIAFIASTSSYAIFCARDSSEWNTQTNYIEPIYR